MFYFYYIGAALVKELVMQMVIVRLCFLSLLRRFPVLIQKAAECPSRRFRAVVCTYSVTFEFTKRLREAGHDASTWEAASEVSETQGYSVGPVNPESKFVMEKGVLSGKGLRSVPFSQKNRTDMHSVPTVRVLLSSVRTQNILQERSNGQ